MRGVLRTTVFTLACAAASVAVAEIRWVERDFDFGLMKEVAGPKTGSSRFVNLGPDTVTVFSVRPSCGCTTADYTDAPLAPGDTATVSYTYNPEMRPGKFDKSVKVRLSDGSHYSIRIRGNVLGTPESLATLYPVDGGEIRLSDAVADAGDIDFGRTRALFVNAYSLAPDSIAPIVVSGSQGLSVTPSTPKAGPGDIITYSLNFNSRRHGEYGPVEIPVTFRANNNTDPVTFRFRVFVLPDTEALAVRQKGKSPACDLSPDPIDLGMNAGSSGPIRTKLTVSNNGRGPLHILRLHAASEAVKFGKTPKEIKAGKRAEVQVEIDPGKLPAGPFRLPVDVITDDPAHPHLQVDVAGNK